MITTSLSHLTSSMTSPIDAS